MLRQRIEVFRPKKRLYNIQHCCYQVVPMVSDGDSQRFLHPLRNGARVINVFWVVIYLIYVIQYHGKKVSLASSSTVAKGI